MEMVSYDSSIDNLKTKHCVHLASCNPIFNPHPLGIKAILEIPKYAERMFKTAMERYEAQGPLLIRISLFGFKGYVTQEVEVFNPNE